MKPLKNTNSKCGEEKEKCKSKTKKVNKNQTNIDCNLNKGIVLSRKDSIDQAKEKANKECDDDDCKKSKGSIGDIFDLSVLKIPAMALLSVANIFGMTGYYIPYVYIAGYAEECIYGK